MKVAHSAEAKRVVPSSISEPDELHIHRLNPVQTATWTQQAVRSYMYMDMPTNQYDAGADIVGTAIITSEMQEIFGRT